MKNCRRCKLNKGNDEFNKNAKNRDGLHSYCRECQRDHYSENATRHKANVKRVRAKRKVEAKAWLTEYLRSHPCVDCGEDDPIVLEFDHVRGTKRYTVSRMVGSHTVENINREIAKCDVRCANCHRRKTAEQFGWLDKHD